MKQLTLEEQKAITTAFSNLSAAQASGVRLAGKKFLVTRTDEGVIHGRMQASSATSLSTVMLISFSTCTQLNGCTIVKTKQAILVTEYDAPIQAAESFPIVYELANYLKSVGY